MCGFVKKPEEKRPHGRPRCRWADNNKMVLKRHRLGGYGMERFGLQERKVGDFIFCWPCISVQFVLITNLTHFLNVFISLLYMFRATQCS